MPTRIENKNPCPRIPTLPFSDNLHSSSQVHIRHVRGLPGEGWGGVCPRFVGHFWDCLLLGLLLSHLFPPFLPIASAYWEDCRKFSGPRHLYALALLVISEIACCLDCCCHISFLPFCQLPVLTERIAASFQGHVTYCFYPLEGLVMGELTKSQNWLVAPVFLARTMSLLKNFATTQNTTVRII